MLCFTNQMFKYVYMHSRTNDIDINSVQAEQ